jgi:hypothetical protein
VLDYFARNPDEFAAFLPGGMGLLIHYLVADGYLKQVELDVGHYNISAGNSITGERRAIRVEMIEAYQLTDAGREFVARWRDALPLFDGQDGEEHAAELLAERETEADQPSVVDQPAS